MRRGNLALTVALRAPYILDGNRKVPPFVAQSIDVCLYTDAAVIRVPIFASVLALAAASPAVVIYDTLGPGDTYQNSHWDVNYEQSIATPFHVSSAGVLSLVKIALSFAPTDYTIAVREGGATVPGATLYSWTFLSDQTGPGVYSLSPSGNVSMPVGDYYIVAESPASWGGGWLMNNTGFTGPFSYKLDDNWNSFNGATGAMLIDVNAVPEPATVAALGLGTLTLLRRRRKA
jgi:hypothetical protein